MGGRVEERRKKRGRGLKEERTLREGRRWDVPGRGRGGRERYNERRKERQRMIAGKDKTRDNEGRGKALDFKRTKERNVKCGQSVLAAEAEEKSRESGRSVARTE